MGAIDRSIRDPIAPGPTVLAPDSAGCAAVRRGGAARCIVGFEEFGIAGGDVDEVGTDVLELGAVGFVGLGRDAVGDAGLGVVALGMFGFDTSGLGAFTVGVVGVDRGVTAADARGLGVAGLGAFGLGGIGWGIAGLATLLGRRVAGMGVVI